MKSSYVYYSFYFTFIAAESLLPCMGFRQRGIFSSDRETSPEAKIDYQKKFKKESCDKLNQGGN